jgi:hypothetical protein
MSSQPDWKKCEDCCKATLSYDSNEVDRISQENQLSCGITGNYKSIHVM